MYRMAMISFILPSSASLNRSKLVRLSFLPIELVILNQVCFRCIEMCLIHDLAESIVGDLTPSDNVSKEDKTKSENVKNGSILTFN